MRNNSSTTPGAALRADLRLVSTLFWLSLLALVLYAGAPSPAWAQSCVRRGFDAETARATIRAAGAETDDDSP